MRRLWLPTFGNEFHGVGRWAVLRKPATGMRSTERTAIILAEGERTRLRVPARSIDGHDVPMQFCPIFAETSMLELTRRRVALAIPPGQTLIVVTRTHERFYLPLLPDVPPSRLVVQPQNRGTAAAILYGLLRSLSVAPATSVAIFPSDHYVMDDAAFMRHVDLAFDGIRARPDLLVLLGITPDGPEVDYGWIEMGDRIPEYFQLFHVKRFWQEPSPELATRLWRSGCLWNSFVIVAHTSTALNLFMKALPELYVSFWSIKAAIGASSEARAIDRVYADLSGENLSEQVLSRYHEQLTVLPVSGVKWCGLGEPDRAIEVLLRAGLRPSGYNR